MSPDANDRCSLAVDVSPVAVDAGCRLALTASVSGLRDGVQQPVVVISDSDGAERARAAVVPAEDGTLTTGEIVIAAPRAVGAYVWRAVLLASPDAGPPNEQAAADVRFTVVPHTLDLVVWDVAPVVVAGRRIRLRAAIKCSGECAMGGQTLSVADAQGRPLATTEFTDERWPETEPIYAAEVEVAAPAAVGQYAWEITATAGTLALAHATASQQMNVRVVPPPDCEATIMVRDRHTDAPLAGASVVLEPYRAITGSDGIATLPIAKGQYDLHVTRRGYKPYSSRIAVRTEIFTTAVLESEPPLTPA